MFSESLGLIRSGEVFPQGVKKPHVVIANAAEAPDKRVIHEERELQNAFNTVWETNASMR